MKAIKVELASSRLEGKECLRLPFEETLPKKMGKIVLKTLFTGGLYIPFKALEFSFTCLRSFSYAVYDHFYGRVESGIQSEALYYPYYPLANKIQNLEMLDFQIIELAKAKLESEVNNLKIITDIKDLSLLQTSVNQLAIPLIIKGVFRNHITTLFVDKEKRTITFIDPKGKALSDYLGSDVYSLSSTQSISVREFWGSLTSKLGEGEWNYEENDKQVQKDGYNCGLHFYHNVMSYSKGNRTDLDSFEQIRKTRSGILKDIMNLEQQQPKMVEVVEEDDLVLV